jgi:tetratricopeptide (TPR) repeat protein
VRYIVEGSVRKDDNQLRITAQLIDATDGSHLWSDSYNRTLENVFQIQVDIAEAIAQELKVPLGIDDASGLVNPTADLEAYDLYLAGRARIRERGESLRQAIRLFEGAIQRDSAWAPAWAGLAEANELISWYTYAWGVGPVPYEEISAGFGVWQAKAEIAANRAFELDPNIASAHVAMGSVHRNRKEWQLGEAAYLRALALDPDNGEAHHQYADLLGQMGRIAEALKIAERGLVLDRLPVRLMNYSTLLAADDRLELAVESAREGIELDPNGLVRGLRRRLLEYRVLTGQFDSMFVHGTGARIREPTEDEKSAAIAALHSGDLESFPEVFLEERDWTSFWMVLGQPDRAAADLLSKVNVRPMMSPTWIWQAVYDPIRQHPEYLETMRALNLEGAVPQRTPR